MAYIPKPYQEQTAFPHEFGRDLQLQVRLIEEKWKRFFPPLPYYSLIRDFGIAAVDSTTGAPAPVAGASGGAFDPVWGEWVDSQMATDGTWDQPHLNPNLDATTEHEIYRTPVTIHFQVRREVKERQLKLWGFDKIRDVIVIAPASFFDACGLRTQEGDKFIWDGEEYFVYQDAGDGWWKNSNIRLYRVLNCEHRRLGS